MSPAEEMFGRAFNYFLDLYFRACCSPFAGNRPFNKSESDLASGADFLSVNFKAGRPAENDPLLDSLESGDGFSEFSPRSDLCLLRKKQVHSIESRWIYG